MDPNANLREQREIVKQLTVAENWGKAFDPLLVSRLTELQFALDEWLTRKGFLPRDWERTPC